MIRMLNVPPLLGVKAERKVLRRQSTVQMIRERVIQALEQPSFMVTWVAMVTTRGAVTPCSYHCIADGVHGVII